SLSTGTTSNLSFGPGSGNTNTGLYIPSSVSNLGLLTINIATTDTVSLKSNVTLNAATALTLTGGKVSLGNFDLTLASTATTSPSGSTNSFVLADAALGSGQLKKTFASGVT